MKQKKCSFCGRPLDDESLIYTGFDGTMICHECAKDLSDQYDRIYKEQAINSKIDEDRNHKPLPTPKQIKDYLDKYVIGQEYAKTVISTAIYNHYKRVESSSISECELQKSCCLLIGPTGTGKTEIARCIAKMLDVPFAIADATSLTQAGYVGDDVETILTKLLQAADYDVAKAEKGIVFIDEIDKIANANHGNPSITRDVSGEGVQQALLKMIEGSDVLVPPKGGRKHPDAPMVKINTNNILFICSGAFVGLDKIIMQRTNRKVIGYGHESHSIKKEEIKNPLSLVTGPDIKRFGLIPELIGRLPIITYTEELSKDTLVKILTEPKNAIVKQYKEMMKIDGVDLKFKKDVYEYIAETAMENKTGARGLRNILEKILLKPMFELPGSDKTVFIVTKKYAEEALKAA